MKKYIIALFLLLASQNSFAYGSCNTQIKPLPPYGCGFNDAVCSCSSYGSCNWVYVGC